MKQPTRSGPLASNNRGAAAVLATAAILGSAACGSDNPMTMTPMVCTGPTGLLPGQAPPDSGTSAFQVRESVAQLQITHAAPGTALTVVNASGAQVASGTADMQGSLMVRGLAAGTGYRVRVTDKPDQQSRALTVVAPDASTPPSCFYSSQKLQPGFNYITTRDGTTLSAYITLPGPLAEGPYPTLVNYSGYDPSRPGKPIDQFKFLCDTFPSICDPPSDPSGLLASFFGFATVSVNVRGTGCSGGAYDFFEALQSLDGYDVIETVAAQDFVLHHKVGMTGLSFPGISQLFVAATAPPSLAAITPLSVIGNSATTLFPGGILNTGFAVQWVTSVLNNADPYGQGWERDRVMAGDKQCAENQLLHSQKLDNVAEAERTTYYDPARVDPLNPSLFVDRIKVPVFLAGAWQDEQTGPYFTQLMNRFTGSDLVRLMVYNGVHPDGFAPQIMSEWAAFLDLFVARRVPQVKPELRGLSPELFNEVYGARLSLPANRFEGQTDYAAVLAAYRKEPLLRAFFENGNGAPAELGAPQATFSLPFTAWPPPETQAQRYYLAPGGALRLTRPGEANAASAFKLDPAAGDRVVLVRGDVNAKMPVYDWPPLRAGLAMAFETPALTEDQLFLGTGSVDLYLRSTADDADVQVTLTELRPDGKELYIQSGWLRASLRALGPRSTELWPEPTMLEKDAKLLVQNEWTPARVAITGFGHLFRKGSRLRLAIDTPGGTRARWRFKLKTFATPVTIAVAHSAARPSSVLLPLIALRAPQALPSPLPALPPCPSLRGQPCRAYQALTNVATAE